MKKKLCLFKNVAYDYEIIHIIAEDSDLDYWINDGQIALSRVVEVNFPELSTESVVNSEIAILDKQITKVMAESEGKINQLKARKQELLAITHDEGNRYDK